MNIEALLGILDSVRSPVWQRTWPSDVQAVCIEKSLANSCAGGSACGALVGMFPLILRVLSRGLKRGYDDAC